MREIITDIEKLSVRADEINPKEDQDKVKEIILDLKTIIRNQNLRGLSAPQIGENVRIVAIAYTKDVKGYVDPMILNCSGIVPVIETDPSLPDHRYLIPRYASVTIESLTANGVVEKFQLHGEASYVMQQQLDHLEGILISDYGLPIGEEFDNMSEDDRAQLIQEYMESLQEQQKTLNELVQEDPETKEIQDGMRFLESVKKGETTIEYEQLSEEEIKRLEAAADAEEENADSEVHDSEENDDE